MESGSSVPVSGSQANSVFSGQKYNPDQNTVTHYKAGNGNGKKKKSGNKKTGKKKKTPIGAAVVKSDGKKYNEKQPDYVQASVFKK